MTDETSQELGTEAGQGHLVAQHVDEVAGQQIGGDGVAAGCGGADQQVTFLDFDRDVKALGAAIHFCANRVGAFALEAGGFLCLAVTRIGQGVDGTQEAEGTGFFFGQADVSSRQRFVRLALDQRGFEFFDRLAGTDEIGSHVDGFVLLADGDDFSGAFLGIGSASGAGFFDGNRHGLLLLNGGDFYKFDFAGFICRAAYAN